MPATQDEGGQLGFRQVQQQFAAPAIPADEWLGEGAAALLAAHLPAVGSSKRMSGSCNVAPTTWVSRCVSAAGETRQSSVV